MLAIETLVRQLGTGEKKKRQQIINSVVSRQQEALPFLGEALYSKELSVSCDAEECLNRINTEQTKKITGRFYKKLSGLEKAFRFLGSEDQQTEYPAEIGEEELDFLLTLLNNRNETTKVKTMLLLQKTNSPRMLDTLITALEDKHAKVRKYALEILVNFRQLKIIIPLLNLVKKNGYDHRVLNALYQIGKPAVQPLIEALGSPDEKIRWFSAAVLGELKDKEAFYPLIKALDDESSTVKWYAVRALSNYRHIFTVKELKKLVDDGDFLVRKNVAQALGKIGGDEAREVLIDILQSTDNSSIRSIAVRGLGEIGGQKAIMVLKEAVKDSDMAVSNSALEVLRKIGINSTVF